MCEVLGDMEENLDLGLRKLSLGFSSCTELQQLGSCTCIGL